MLSSSTPIRTSAFRRTARNLNLGCLLTLFAASFIPSGRAGAQQPQLPENRPRITQPVNESILTTLKGNVHPLALPKYDQGAASPALPMKRMLMVLQRSAVQEHALKTLIDEQQDKKSSSYHQWLTPAELGAEYGPAEADVQTVTRWLQSQGFQIGSVSKARTVIEFSGTAGQVQNAFHTTIHSYLVKGEQHYANSTDPQIPSALAPVVGGIVSLHDFRKQPFNHFAGNFQREKSTGKTTLASASKPQFTYPLNSSQNFYAIGPYDLATIYNILPLWNASPALDGTGQTIAIAGRSNIDIQDAYNFRTLFGLPTGGSVTAFQQQYLNIILNGPDPGNLGFTEEGEADIDTQWSGAVAKGALIDFVISQSTESTDGVDLSALYIIDNNLAPVMSESFGECELGWGTSGNVFINALWEQAAAQGISVFVSSGDEGSASCDAGTTNGYAQVGLSVSGTASTPYDTAVGGTDFDQLGVSGNSFTPTSFWNATNNTNQASAKGYIPETTWNNSCTNAAFAAISGSTDPLTNCNDADVLDPSDGNGLNVTGGSGGPSTCIVSDGQNPSSCQGGYAKPAWQTGNNVPQDNVRDVPDISLFASNGFAATIYIVCQQSQNSSGAQCDLNSPYADFQGYGGTSVASPAVAGAFAILNQSTKARVGNANYALYNLAAKQSASSCNSTKGPGSSCIINDVTVGTISQPCLPGSTNCGSASGDSYGVLITDNGQGYNTPDSSGYPSDLGYNTATGYDYATGLGSINVANLVNQWSTANFTATATNLSLSSTSFTHGAAVSGTVTVTSGGGTPSGDVSFNGVTSAGASVPNSSIGFATLTNGTVTANLNALNAGQNSFGGALTALPGGSYNVVAHYGGNGTSTNPFGGSDSNPVAVTIAPEASTTTLSFYQVNPSTGRATQVTTASYGSFLLARADIAGASGLGIATGNVGISLGSTAVPGSPFALNSQGYTEDQSFAPPTGSNTVTANYTGDPSFNMSTGTATFVVTQAVPTATLASSATSIAPGASVTLTAVFDTTSYASGPTGTVQFTNNGSALGSPVAVTAGTDANGFPQATAVLTTTTLPSGNNAITAVYSGDANFAAVTSPGVTVTVSSTPVNPSFAFTPAPGAVTFTAGATTGNTSTVSITPSNGFTGSVALTATLTMSPAGAVNLPTISFNPTSITITGSAVGTSVATIATTANTSGALAYPKTNRWYTGAGGAALACVLLFGIPARRRSWRAMLALLVCLVGLAEVGCGGGSSGGGGNSGTTTGTYIFTVTGTSGTTSKTGSITVTVQ